MAVTTSQICPIFVFLAVKKIGRKWQLFCRRAEDKFLSLVDPKICSLHFRKENLKKEFSGKISVVRGAVSTIFDPEKEAAKKNLCKERIEKRVLVWERSTTKMEEFNLRKEKIHKEDCTNILHSQPEFDVQPVGLPDHDYTSITEH